MRAPDRIPTAIAASVVADRLQVALADGREIFVPVEWFDWLAVATPEDRAELEIIEGGEGIWWHRLDDGISVPGLFGLPHS